MRNLKCMSLGENLTTSISPVTIGMDETIDDSAAIEFSRGFYGWFGSRKSD